MAEAADAKILDVARGPLRTALSGLCAQVYPGYRIARVRCLRGGVDAATHRIDLIAERPTASPPRSAPPPHSLVLRRYGAATLTWNPNAPERLWHTLRVLSDPRLGIVAPRPLLLDSRSGKTNGEASGRRAQTLGAPTLLMSYIPGRSTLSPRDLGPFVRGLATGLARIHAIPDTHPGLSHLPSPADQLERVLKAARENFDLRTVPEGAAIARVLAQTDARRLLHRSVLLHGDYWAGNVLWDQGQLCAVIDWDQAGRGAAGYDVSYCRVDLALLFGPHVADDFLHAYEQAAGTTLRDLSTWDLLAASRALPTGRAWLPGYHGLGRRDLDEQTTGRRLHEFLRGALARTRLSGA